MDTKTDPHPPRMVGMEHWLIRCDSCGTIDHLYTFGDFGGYGQALGRTCFGKLAEFSAWEDPVYEELLGIVRTFMVQRGGRCTDCFNMVMSVVADPAPSGERYKFINNLCCRQCGSNANWYKLMENPS